MFTHQTLELTATTTATAPAYQWYVDGTAVTGATNATFNYQPGTAGLTTDALGNHVKKPVITCRVTTAAGTATSNEYPVQVVQATLGELSPIYVNAWNEAGTALQKVALAHVNLGAENATNPCDMLGDLYQWGRPADGHQLRYSATMRNNISHVAPPGHGDFILNGYSPVDWLQPQDNTLWGDGTDGYNQAKVTINDPCPAGWKVPSQKQWGAVYAGGVISGDPAVVANKANTWIWLGTGAGYKVGDVLYLPAAGYRSTNNVLNGIGKFMDVGEGGYYWSSTPVSIMIGTIEEFSSFPLRFDNTNVNISTRMARAHGPSVRCIQE